jgi:hypothetical protein
MVNVMIIVGLLLWVAFSFVFAPVVGLAVRGADVMEKARSVEALQARAQHPASRAA